MAVAVAASLIGVYAPRTVQIVVSGLTVGVDYEVTGSWAGGSWPVRAGSGTATDTQRVLSDLAAPINTPITYTVTHAGSQATTSPLTVDFDGSGVVQSLDGSVSVAVEPLDNGAPWSLELRHNLFAIPGRSRPLPHLDVAAGESSQVQLDTEGQASADLKALLRAGMPLLLRSDGLIADLDPALFVLVTAVSSVVPIGATRRWTLDYRALDDPEPDTLAGLPTWDDFDDAYAGLTWADFDSEFSGLTWDDFDLADWALRAAA